MRLVSITAVGLLGLASNAMAQSSSAPTPSSSASTSASASSASSSLIPTGISQGCSDFMNSLNSDPNIQACTQPLLSATQYYANATDAVKDNKAASNVTTSADALQSSLGQLCASQTGCQPDVIRTQLSKFWNACSNELKAKNQGVLGVYDVLYLINPFHDAVCTVDDSKNYCVLSIANNTATKEAATSDGTQAATSKRALLEADAGETSLLSALTKRQDASASATSNTIDTASNIAFLFLQPNSDKSILCSSCSKNILAAYIQFETSIPYAIGLANSENLKGQSDLYKAMQSTCGGDFSTSINQLAGTTAFAEVGGAMGQAATRVGIALGIASLLAAMLVL